jgi:Fur family ferric uptake transcriptional regulator
MNYSAEKTLTQFTIKPTAMRLLVLDYLHQHPYAISISDLENDFDKVDRITLYRTLKTFEEHKLIHSIDDGTGIPKYALCQEGCQCGPQDAHVHFHCDECKLTYCLPNLHIPSLTLPRNFEANQLTMTVRGRCDRCTTT